MKKIIAAAVATAFVAPAFAGEFASVTGYSEWSWTDANGTESTAQGDNTIKFTATGETSTGVSISADFNFNSNQHNDLNANASTADQGTSANDGGDSLTVSGGFGTIDMGDVNSANDAINGVTEFARINNQGTSSPDAAIIWTLPTMVEGLTVHASTGAATSNGDDGIADADSVAISYTAGGAKVGYGQLDRETGVEETLVNLSYSMSGITAAYEIHSSKATTGIDTDTKNMGVKYTTGDISISWENSTTKASNTSKANDETVMAFEYAVGDGLVIGVETYDDSVVASSEKTSIYAGFAF